VNAETVYSGRREADLVMTSIGQVILDHFHLDGNRVLPGLDSLPGPAEVFQYTSNEQGGGSLR
jgi:hypothetical protein